jgi:hypothetical protein
LREPLSGVGSEPPGRVQYLLVRRRGDAQQRLGQVDRRGRDAEPVEHRDPLHEYGGVQRTRGVGRHGQQERLRVGLDDVERLGEARLEQLPGRGEVLEPEAVGEVALSRLVAAHRRGHVVHVGLGEVHELAGLLAHDRLQRPGQRGTVEVGVPDQSVQDPLERHHVLVVRDDRRELLGDLYGRLDGARYRARLGHGGQHLGVLLGELGPVRCRGVRRPVPRDRG